MQTRIINQQSRPPLQRRYLIPQNLDTVKVCSVVEDGAEEIDFGVFGVLRR